MEKPRPHYDLDAFQARFDSPEKLSMTLTAARDAADLGFDDGGIVDLIQSIERVDFFKSMTSYADHTVWQDVYHVPWNDQVIYLKFTEDEVTEFHILSFKEK